MRFLSFAAALVGMTAGAYPIPPQTLWDLTASNELVVLARVETTRHEKGGDVAVLEVLETWKGVSPKKVEVSYVARMVCPAPPRFLEGRHVVAFLAKDDGAWTVGGRSYGTRYPQDGNEEREIKAAVMAVPAGAVSHQPTLAWAAAVAVARSTRWDALFALRHASAAIADDPAAMRRLEELMVAAPSYDATLPWMLALLKKTRSARIDAAAADAIETVLHHGPAPHWMESAIDLFEERLGPIPPESPATGIPEGDLQVHRWKALKQRLAVAPKVRGDWTPVAP